MKTTDLKTSFLILLLVISGCDFSSYQQKEILKAQELISDKKYTEAISYYENILRNKPSLQYKLKVLFRLGELYSIYLNNGQKSLEYFAEIKNSTNDPLWQIGSEEKIADANFFQIKNYKASADSYRSLIKFRPKAPKFDYYEHQLGRSYMNMNKLDESTNIFLNIIKNPRHNFYADALKNLGHISYRRKKWKRAIFFWKKQLSIETRKNVIVQTKFMIANVYETTEELKKAYEIYYSILGNYPNKKVLKNRLNSIYDRRISRKR